jgi:uncharacterized membrane protein YeaQ/YmgE (transglycosylase-associated protein family)
MTLENIILWIVVGGVAGWLASQIMKGGGLRITGNHIVDTIITGIAGAFIGGWLLGLMRVAILGGLAGAILNAVIGAMVLIFVLGLLRR